MKYTLLRYVRLSSLLCIIYAHSINDISIHTHKKLITGFYFEIRKLFTIFLFV